MNSELVINSTAGEVNIALLEEKRLVELNSEKKDQSFQVGDIYLGRVKKLIPSLNAAFVDVGHEKDAFLHYLDLGPQVQSLLKLIRLTTTGKNPDPLLNGFQTEQDINKGGKITQVLSPNQWVLVQVAKEPISSKGPRITSEISLAGRFVVLVPFSEMVSISQKIKSAEERQRLKRLAMSIKPKGFGIIVRTVADGKKVAELDKDIQDLVSKWKSIFNMLLTAKPPQKILGELNRTSTILRDLLNANFNAIHVNEPSLVEEIKSYITNIAPEQVDIVKLYKGKLPIFEQFGVEKQIKSAFGKTVTMANGSYLIVEHTEAMHVIDVNSGGRVKGEGGDTNQENNALQVNLDAAAEVARQLRMRDMGGIIVVDFIDMHNAQNRKALFERLKTEMKKDRAKHTILPPSKFGLIQITRQRVRPETNITTVEKCPACDGTGEIKASILLIDEIENNLRYFVQEQNEHDLSLVVHPYIEAYLNKGFFFKSITSKWKKKYRMKLKVTSNSAYHIMEYHFFNKNVEEIKI
ncbi:MAG: Rne/Rng family ribonuclease [Bacteroidia bacterium]|nr:Rne/Rng family ribonuclease [Bacteroidia bacterium]